VDVPDYSELPTHHFDWMNYDIPSALGKKVTTTHRVDANLMPCLITGRFLIVFLPMCNQTPIDRFSKKQNTVETL